MSSYALKSSRFVPLRRIEKKIRGSMPPDPPSLASAASWPRRLRPLRGLAVQALRTFNSAASRPLVTKSTFNLF